MFRERPAQLFVQLHQNCLSSAHFETPQCARRRVGPRGKATERSRKSLPSRHTLKMSTNPGWWGGARYPLFLCRQPFLQRRRPSKGEERVESSEERVKPSGSPEIGAWSGHGSVATRGIGICTLGLDCIPPGELCLTLLVSRAIVAR